MSRLDALDPANCPNGIDRKRVDACVNAMRAEICGSESRSTAGCTISALCASP